MTTDHTPGPWREGDRGMIEAEPRDGTLSEAVGAVAFVYGPFEAHGQANARLISAAPDLLALCEELLPELACHCDEGFTSRGRHEPNTLCHYYDELKAVIAKAKGEPHAR